MHLLKIFDEQHRGITLYRGNSRWALRWFYWLAKLGGENNFVTVINGDADYLEAVEEHFPERGKEHDDRLDSSFPITSVARQDLIDAGFPAEVVEKLSHNDMEHLAAEMADDYIGQLFWSHLKFFAEQMIQEIQKEVGNEAENISQQ